MEPVEDTEEDRGDARHWWAALPEGGRLIEADTPTGLAAAIAGVRRYS